MAATLLLAGDTSDGLPGGRLHREADLPLRHRVATDGQTSATLRDLAADVHVQQPLA